MEAPSPPDVIVAVELRWRPSSRSRPVLFQDDQRAVLIFEPARAREAGALAAFKQSVAATAPIANERVELRFEDCLAVRFGYPDDQARAGHPLLGGAPSDYGLLEVTNSSWPGLLADQHRSSPPNAVWPPFPVRHFIVTFKEATFECLCASVRGRATDLSVPQIIEALKR